MKNAPTLIDFHSLTQAAVLHQVRNFDAYHVMLDCYLLLSLVYTRIAVFSAGRCFRWHMPFYHNGIKCSGRWAQNVETMRKQFIQAVLYRRTGKLLVRFGD